MLKTRICLCSLVAAVVVLAGCGRVSDGGVTVTDVSGSGTDTSVAVGDASSVFSDNYTSGNSDTSGTSGTSATTAPGEFESGGHMGGTATEAAIAVSSDTAVHVGVEDMNADSGVIPYTTAAGDVKDHITVDIDFVGIIGDIDELDTAKRAALPSDGVLVLNAEVTAVTPLEAVEKACEAANLGFAVKDGVGVTSIGGLTNGDIDGASWRIIVNGRDDTGVLKQPLKKGDKIRVSYDYSAYN